MALITLEELARGACIGVFGGAAGACTLVFPGSPIWLVPAAAAVGGCALTVPEVRQEVVRVMPMLASGAQRARAALPAVAWQLPGIKAEKRPQSRTEAPERATAPAPDDRPELIATLDEQPHRLIIGHTRGGKTTLSHEMATGWARRGERVLVGDPDAAPGLWPGCEVRGYGDDVQSIGELLTVVQGEVEARRLARAQGVRRFEPLHLVIDEAQDVLPALDGGLELMEDVARRGGKLNIRMTVGVQDKQVKTLRLEGKSALLRNFQIADVMKNREGRRVAVLRDPETGQKVSMPIPQLTDPETLITVRPATETTQNLRRPAQSPVPADDLLASLLATDAPVTKPSLDERIAAVLGQAAPVPSASQSERPHVPNAQTGTWGHGDTHTGVVLEAGDRGELHLHLHARAEAHAPATAQPAGKWQRKGPRVERRRLALSSQGNADELHRAYRDGGAAGTAYRAIYRELGGNKTSTLAAWQEGRAQRQKGN